MGWLLKNLNIMKHVDPDLDEAEATKYIKNELEAFDARMKAENAKTCPKCFR